MSFILDALRKSELERQRQSGPMIAELPVAYADRRLPWALLAVGLLLALNVGVLLFFLLRDTAAPAAARPAATTQAAAAPVAAEAPAPVAAAPMPAVANSRMSPASTSLPDAAAPDWQPMPGAESIPPPAPDPTLLPVAPAGSAHVTRLPAAELPPSIDEMPAQATAGLPELSVDLHIYADDPAKRAVFINGRRYQQGGVLVEGPTIEEITRDGAVLRYRGQRFLLPRQ